MQANRTVTLDAQLKVGQVATTIEVTGTPLRNEVDTTVGYVLDSLTIERTPLGTGSFTQLALLSPGVNAEFLAGSGPMQVSAIRISRPTASATPATHSPSTRQREQSV